VASIPSYRTFERITTPRHLRKVAVVVLTESVSGFSPVSTSEQWFLNTCHVIGSVGVLVLKSLAYLTVKGGGESVQISRETLARHCGRSIRTVSRTVAKLKALSLIEASQPVPQAFDCWEPNVYRLTALGRHLAALLGTGSLPADPPTARAIPDIPVPLQSNSRNSEVQTSAPEMARPENIEEKRPGTAISQPVPSLGQDLELIIKALEQADARRFRHLPDWVFAKLRAGVSRCHMREALAALLANLDRVQSWAGWVQNRLEDLGKAEQIAEQRRQAAIENEAKWHQQRKQWEAERDQNRFRGQDLLQLFLAERRPQGQGSVLMQC
jgi:regulatory Crp family protein